VLSQSRDPSSYTVPLLQVCPSENIGRRDENLYIRAETTMHPATDIKPRDQKDRVARCNGGTQ